MKLSEENELALRRIRHVTLVGFWINAALVVLKLSFGYYGNSDALVADGYHSLSDFLTDFIVLFFVGIAYRKPDRDHPYGHGKFETIASVIIAIVLALVGIGIGWQAVDSIIRAAEGEILPRPDIFTIFIAIISIVAKEYCFRYTIKNGKQINSPALIANAWHHRSDAISSVATLIGVSLSYFLSDQWRVLDPIAALIIGIFILISAFKIAMPSINELLEISVSRQDYDNIEKIIRRVPGVKHVHNLKCRHNGHSMIIDVNIHVDPEISVRMGHEIATDVEKDLRSSLGKDLIIYIHVEPNTEAEMHHNAEFSRREKRIIKSPPPVK